MSDGNLSNVTTYAVGSEDPAVLFTQSSEVLFRGKCRIFSAMFSAEGGNDYVDIYDGVNANGKHLCRIAALNHTAFNWPVRNNVLCQVGVYVEINGSNGNLTLQVLGEIPSKKAI